jgi:sucrose-phosphate synthase
MEIMIKPKKESPIYVLMISLHGLIRSKELELGRDADTGGQTLYVTALAENLAKHPEVEKVDLVTRLVDDEALSDDYAKPIEKLNEYAQIVRLDFGPSKYIKKESLWGHLNQAVDKCLSYLRTQGRLPDLIHTHYADAGYVGEQLSELLGIPQIHTGHSLGRPKKSRMLASGRKEQAIEKLFNFEQRIEVEESVIENASLIITSTKQEIDDQYGMYDNHQHSRYSVIPPGTDTSRFSPPGRKKIVSNTQAAVDKYLSDPEKPLIISISRADARKNIKGLVTAYAQSQSLQDKANLLIVAGTRNDIRTMDEAQRNVLTNLLFDIDTHDLWGKVAIPKFLTQSQIPELYRLAAKRKGVFVNPAFTEPFGLTLIEAAASGLPIMAPDDGGPRDIIQNCQNGLVANTLEPEAIAAALEQLLSDAKKWRQYASRGLSGVAKHYSWPSHVVKYMKEVRKILRKTQKQTRRQHAYAQSAQANLPLIKQALISDIDNTLIGDQDALNTLMQWRAVNKKNLAFGVATGRTLESTLEILKKHNVRLPDVLITSVGSEIHYGKNLTPDVGWASHIRHRWRREDIAEAMKAFSNIRLQSAENQREFKLSYLATPDQMPPIKELQHYLSQHKLYAQLIYSHEEFLDILPARASKGQAVRYLSYKWGLPIDQIIVSGDSGNDIEMLRGDTKAIVVGNYSPELGYLRHQEHIYFANAHFAAGIAEGISHYQPLLSNLISPIK